MKVATPFGYLDIPEDVSHARKAAALRALDWCFSIVQESHLLKKGRKKHGSWGASITRKINGKKVAVYPLVAAHYDVGSGRYGSLAFQDHIPVEVNSASVCITVAPAQEASTAKASGCQGFTVASYQGKTIASINISTLTALGN